MPATGKGRLTNSQIVRLAESITARSMETIAMKYLDVDWEEVEKSKTEHRGDMEGFNQDMIRTWAFRTPGPNQVTVGQRVNLAVKLGHVANFGDIFWIFGTFLVGRGNT